MALHRLSSITIGVPNPAETIAYYTEFGLQPAAEGWLSSTDGGNQLRVTEAPVRRLIEVRVGADDHDDLAAAASRLQSMGVPARLESDELVAHDLATGVRAIVQVENRLQQAPQPGTPYNGPGRYDRIGTRAPGLLRSHPVRPRKLGHAVLATTDLTVTTAFFRDGLGFKASDYVKDVGAFLRCSIDHHNILVLNAPVTFLHHTSWQVDDIDDIGRGATRMLEDRPERHVWGLGRHHAGSNFFWYLKDPAGNFSEYYSDMDCIIDDQLWTPQTLEGALGLFNWGPPPPPSFLHPEDLAALMTGAHSTR
jgi:catechol 2,3-dioxygenase-like lactoylglutathione lyase family enzyme